MQTQTQTEIATLRQANAHTVNLVMQHLRDAANSDRLQIPYSELSELISDDAQKDRGRRLVNKARKNLINEHGIFFSTEFDVGLRLVQADAQVKVVSETHRKKITSTVKSWRTNQDQIRVTQLSDKGIEAFTRESLRLALYEDTESSLSQSKIKAAMEVAKAKGEFSRQTLNRCLHTAMSEMARLG